MMFEASDLWEYRATIDDDKRGKDQQILLFLFASHVYVYDEVHTNGSGEIAVGRSL